MIPSNPPQLESPGHDWVLDVLVKMAYSGRLNLGITLIVGGAVVTGTLVGPKEYFELYGKIWTDAFRQQDIGNKLGEIWTKLAEHNFPTEQDINKLEESRPSELSFIHLKDARIVSGPVLIPTLFGMLWRCRLSDVQGFTIGTLAISN